MDAHEANDGSEYPEIPAMRGEPGDAKRVRLLTVEQTAHALGLGRTTTWHLITTGEIESVVIGRKARRVPYDAIDTYVERLRSQVETAAARAREG